MLGVLLTANLSLDKHVSSLTAKCFFQLRQHVGLRSIRRSLDNDSVAFVTRRVDYCVSVRVGLLTVRTSKKSTDRLQRVLNAAARGFTDYSYLGLFVPSLDDSYHVEKGNIVYTV